jgi:hypothetical protein
VQAPEQPVPESDQPRLALGNTGDASNAIGTASVRPKDIKCLRFNRLDSVSDTPKDGGNGRAASAKLEQRGRSRDAGLNTGGDVVGARNDSDAPQRKGKRRETDGAGARSNH